MGLLAGWGVFVFRGLQARLWDKHWLDEGTSHILGAPLASPTSSQEAWPFLLLFSGLARGSAHPGHGQALGAKPGGAVARPLDFGF